MKPFDKTMRRIPPALHGPLSNSFSGMYIHVHSTAMLILFDNRLKKMYLKYSREIQGTGEGVKRTDGEHANLIGESSSRS
jgi:hypothetical protein